MPGMGVLVSLVGPGKGYLTAWLQAPCSQGFLMSCDPDRPESAGLSRPRHAPPAPSLLLRQVRAERGPLPGTGRGAARAGLGIHAEREFPGRA